MKLHACAAAALLLPGVARAGDFFVGAQIEQGLGLEQAESLGTGFGGRFGYQLGFTIGHIAAETEFTYYTGARVAVPKLGGRVHLGKFIEPGVYMHLAMPFAAQFPAGTLGFDGGVVLDVTAIPHFDFGLYGGVEFFGDGKVENPPDQELVGGAHVAVKF